MVLFGTGYLARGVAPHYEKEGTQMMMGHKQMEMAKGVGIGMALGGALGLGLGAMKQPKYQRSMKKGVNKAMKMVGNVMDAIS